MKERREIALKETHVVIGWFKQNLWVRLVDLNYNLEYDWLIELSDKKLYDAEKWEFF